MAKKVFHGAGVGSTTITARYTAGGVEKTASINITVNKANGSAGTTSGITVAYSTSNQTVNLSNYLTGNTGTITWPSSITVKKGTTTQSGFTFNSSTGVVTIPGSRIPGSYTITATVSVGEGTNHNAVSSAQLTWSLTITKAPGDVGTAVNPDSHEYTYSGYNIILTTTGNTGTVSYPTSFNVNGTTWNCTTVNGYGRVTVPSGTNVGTYTLTGNLICTGDNYYEAVTTGQSRTWTFTVTKAPNPLTISPTSKTIYNTSGYNTVQISTSNAQGTVTYSSNNTSKATVSSSGLVTYVAAGSATITVTAAGNSNYESGSKTCAITTKADAKSTYGDVSLTVSSPSTPYAMAVTGETKAITASASQTITWLSGRTTNGTVTITYSVKTSQTGFSLSSNSVSVTNNTSESARDGFVVTVTATGEGSKVASSDRTFNQAAGEKVYDTPTITSNYTYENFAAGGETKTPNTITYSQAWTWNGVSNDGGTITTGGTFEYTKGTLTSGATAGTNFATDGSITWASRSTTIGNERDTASALSVTVTLNGKTSAAKACSSCKQNGNYVTAVTPRASSGSAHFKYENIGPSDSSASPTLTGAATYTFSSGSTSTSKPSTGTATYTRTYSLGTVQNGFTAVNSSSGVLTATPRGTDAGAARKSGTVTSVLTITYQHSSTYSAGGTVTSSQMTSTATCTQGANAVENLVFGVNENTIVFGESTYGEVKVTYTTGDVKLVPSEEVTFTVDTPDTLSITTTPAPSNTNIVLMIDDFTYDLVNGFGCQDMFDFIQSVYNGSGQCYKYSEDIEIDGETYYLWKRIHDDDEDYIAQPKWYTYIVTDTINVQTLRNYSIDEDLNNVYTHPLLAILSPDTKEYTDPENWCIVSVNY